MRALVNIFIILYWKCAIAYDGCIAWTPGCTRIDSEMHETVLLDCTTGETGIAIQ